MPDVGVYRINGTGRDTYISHDNGGNFLGYHADLQPLRGTVDFGQRKAPKHFSRPGQNNEGKKVGYFPNGTGRDTYIA